MLLLGSLPDTWETLKVTLCNSAPNGTITWNLVKTKVLNEDPRRIAEKITCSSHSEVLVTKSRVKSKSRGPKKGGAESRSKSRGRNTKMVCFYCHDKGHKKWQCRKWKNEKGKKNKEA